MEFPKAYPKCPYCGSEELLGKEVIQAVSNQLKVVPNLDLFFLEQNQLQLSSPQNLVSSEVPVLVRFYDHCADCGAHRLVRVEIAQGHLQMKPNLIVPQIQPRNIGRN